MEYYSKKHRWHAWSQREIDGFFYNRFLNGPLNLALTEARRIRMGCEDPPYPCQWNDPIAQNLFFGPWGNGSLLRFDGPDQWQSLLEGFAIDPAYLYNSLVHGSPIPFIRAWPRWNLVPQDHPPPPFRLEVYALPFGERERRFIKVVYENFRELMFWEPRFGPRLEDRRTGANVVANFRSDGPFRLEIISNTPYASPAVFVQIAKEATEEYRSKLPGKSNRSGIPTLREWVVYLLTEQCDLSNRDAIKQWNSMMGNHLKQTYTMDDTDSKLRGHSVGSPGEAQFSGDKSNLERRIDHYRSTLTGALPSSS